MRVVAYLERNPDDTLADVARLDRVIARDQTALGELYDAHSRLLFGLILRILRDRSEAEEVLQEVFVQTWTRAGTYHSSLGSPVGWLVGIARNRAIDRLRTNAARGRLSESMAPTPNVGTPEGYAVAEERQLDIRRALDELPSEQRDLIEQAFFLGFTHSELAARLDLPLGTVKTRIRRGMVTLREKLDAGLIRQ